MTTTIDSLAFYYNSSVEYEEIEDLSQNFNKNTEKYLLVLSKIDVDYDGPNLDPTQRSSNLFFLKIPKEIKELKSYPYNSKNVDCKLFVNVFYIENITTKLYNFFLLNNFCINNPDQYNYYIYDSNDSQLLHIILCRTQYTFCFDFFRIKSNKLLFNSIIKSLDDFLKI